MSDKPTNFPLAWPAGWKRMAPGARRSGNFRKYDAPITIALACDRVLLELERFGCRDITISTNIEPTLSGRPRSGERKPNDPGVAVYWRDGYHKDRCMAIDLYDEVAQNIAAVAATIDAMRAIERHGGALILDKAFAGFTALPAPMAVGMKRDWREVLDEADANLGRVHTGWTIERVELAYRRLAMLRHPDKGGSDAKMAELNAARDEALRELAP